MYVVLTFLHYDAVEAIYLGMAQFPVIHIDAVEDFHSSVDCKVASR